MKKLFCLVVSVLFLVGVGCDEDPTGTTPDAGTKPDLAAPDLGSPDQAAPDMAKVDGPSNMWPDSGKPEAGKKDSSATFGCTTHAECFGQKCCPTPWGVKLCSPDCLGAGKP